MRFLHLLILSLATVITAIDIRFTYNGCNGWAFACTNANPTQCCDSKVSTDWIVYTSIPKDWQTVKTAYHKAYCNDVAWQEDRNKGWNCDHNTKLYRSAKWTWKSINAESAAAAGAGNKTECATPDTFFLDENTKYAIGQLDDGQIE